MKKILITGGGGFIGSHLAEYYAKQDVKNEITIIDNLSRAHLLNQQPSEKYLYNWNYLHKLLNIQFIQNDVRELKLLKDVFRENEYDIVFHTAGQTAVETSIKSPFIDFKNNVVSSLNLLEAIRCTESDPKIIFCSTNKVYGTKVNELLLKETDFKYNPQNQKSKGIGEDVPIDQTQHTPYGVSKLAADLYFQEYGYSYGLKTGVFRMSCIYGPRQLGVEAQGWISHFIISALTDKNLIIYGSGKQTRDILYITDLVRAFDQFIKKDITNEVFCIGGGTSNIISPLQLIDTLEKKLEKSISVIFSDWRKGDQKYYVTDISKARNMLDWSPQTSLNIGLDKTIKWYNDHIELFT